MSAVQDEVRRRAEAERLASGAPKVGSKRMVGGKAFAGGLAIDTFLNMKAGDDFGTAAVKGAFTGMLWSTMPGIMTAATIGQLVPSVVSGVNNWKRQKESWWNQQFMPNFGGAYKDTQRALTMRQSAVQAIQGSKLNARSALGGEAKLLSQNSNF